MKNYIPFYFQYDVYNFYNSVLKNYMVKKLYQNI